MDYMLAVDFDYYKWVVCQRGRNIPYKGVKIVRLTAILDKLKWNASNYPETA